MPTAFVITAFVAAFLLAAPAAALGPPCGPRQAVAERLKKDHGEMSVSEGVLGREAVLEVFVSKTGSYSVVVTKTNGISCIIVVGENWERKPLPWRQSKERGT